MGEQPDVPGIDLRENPKFDTEAKIESRQTTLFLKKRRLEQAFMNGAYLPRVDLTGAQLQGFSSSPGRR